MTYSLYSALPIDPATIAMVFDVGFFVIIGFIILGFLIGLIRGFWKSGFRLIVVGGLVIAAFVLTRPLSDYIATINFGEILPTFGVNLPVINLNLVGTPITLTITTIQETILSFVTQMFTGLGLSSGDSQATADLIYAFTLVLIRYISFIVIGILVVTFGDFIAVLFYFFPFRLFIPKSWRKRHKLRLLGGFANAIKVTLVTVMMMVPFSSLLNTINQAFRNPDNGVVEGVTDETYNSIMGFLDAYDQSMFAQFLFNWYVDENGKTLDTTLMDYMTGETVGDYTLTLSNEITSIASIGQTILSTGALTSGLTDATLQLALTEDIIASLFINLTGSGLIMKILPIAMAVAMNAEVVQSYVDPSLLDLETVNWEDELINIKDISVEVIRSGILDQILDPEAPEMTAATILPLLIDDEAYPHVRLALQSIDNSEFLSQVMPAVLYTLTQDEITAGLPAGTIGISTFLPTEWEDYSEIQLGEELALVYDAFHSLMGLDPDLLAAIMALVLPATPSGDASYEVAEEGYKSPFLDPELDLFRYPNRQTAYDDLITIIRENSDALIKLIVGDLDSNGVPTNVDLETGKTLLFDDDGVPITDATTCLFDSGILVYGLDRVLSSVLTPALAGLAGGSGFDTTTLDAAIVELNGITNGEKRFNYKGEFGAVLGIVTAILGNDSLLSLIIPTGSNSSSSSGSNPVVPSIPGFKQRPGEPLRSSASDSSSSSQTSTNIIDMFSDADFRSALKDDVFPLLDRSRIMGAVIPSVMETALSGDTMNGFLEILGMTTDDLNFAFSDVGTQMGYLVDLIGYSFSVMDVGVENIFDDIEAISSDMIGLLDSLYLSDIINPKDEDGTMLSENYYSLLGTLFEQAADLGLDPDEVDAAARTISFDPGTGYDGWTTTYDVDGNLVNAGENYNLVNFVVIALGSDLLALDPANGDLITQMITFAQDPEDPIGDIFRSVDSSVIISATFGGVLDGFFGTTGGLIDEDLGTSFRNVVDWETEGDNLKTIIISLEGFSEGLAGIDFLNSDPLLLGDILKGLARSQIFNNVTTDAYLFPDFLLGNLKGVGSIVGTYLYDPYEDDVINDGDPFTEITSDFHAVGDTILEADAWYEDNGEIDTILGFVTAIKDVTGDAPNPITFLQTDTSITSTDIESIMLALNDASSLRVLLYNLFESLLGTDQFSLGTLSPSDSNTYIFMTLNEAERAVEIGYLATLFGSIKSLDLSGGFNMEALSPENLSEVETMLNTMHDSKLFNTFDNSAFDRGIELEERSHANDDMTVFEQTINMMLDVSTLDSYIYKNLAPGDIPAALQTDIVSIPNDLAGTVVLTDEWSGNDGEIKKIFNIISSFKDTGISFADFGGDGADSISTLMSTSEGTTKVENLLLTINDSRIVNPAIGHLFDEIFTSGAFALSGVDLTQAHTSFFLDEEDKNLRAQEISVLIDIYSDIDGLALNNGGALTIASIDSARINLMLNNLHDSQVFNTFNAGDSHAALDLTIFEQTVAMVIDTATLDTYIYPGLDEAQQEVALTDDIILIGNNFADTVVVSDEWIGVGGEISNITNILESFKATEIDFTSFGTDGGNAISTLMDNPVGLNKAENLLIDINHSLLIHPAIPGLFDQIFTTDAYELNGLNLSDANTNYFRDEADVDPRDTEITLLVDIYAQMDGLSLNHGGSLSLDGIDSIEISSMLINIHSSAVLNSLIVGKSHLTNDLTIFEQTIKMIYTATNFTSQIYPDALEGDRPGLLTADIIAINNEFAPLDPLTEDEWEATLGGEISNLKGILDALVAIDIPFADFSSDLGVQGQLNTLIADPVGKEKIRDLMQAINLSLIAWPADPNLLENMFSTASFSVTGVTLSDSNPLYLHSMPIASERAIEIDSVLNVYDIIDQLGINAGSFDVSMIDSVVIRDLLETFHESVVFNTLRDEMDRLAKDLTVFEQTIRMIIDTSELDSYIYKGMSGPQTTVALAEDIIARDNDFAGTVPLADDGWMDQGDEREITKILDILDMFLATSLDFSSFGGVGSNQLLSDLMDTPAGVTSVENLLLAVNHSEISYPAVPNLFDTMLTAGDASITGVDFETAYTHYRGNRLGLNVMEDKYSPYDDAEIGNILDIFNNVKAISGQSFTNLSSLTIGVIDDMQYLVESLFQSHVFHLEGSSSLVASDPTVFEQIIIKMMTDTSISSLLYHDTVVTSPNPNPIYYVAAVYRFASAAEKTEFIVVNYENPLLYNSVDHFTSSWDGIDGEIVAVFRIFREMKRVLPTLVDAASVDPATMSPSAVGAIMSALNYSNLSSDAVPNLVRDAFASISFAEYTENNEEYYLTPKTYDLLDLDTMDYSDTDFTDVNPPELVGGIGLIRELMEGFYEGDGLGYYDMGLDFDIVDFIVTNGKSSVPIFHLLKSSNVFAPIVDTKTYKTRSLTLYNLLDPIDITKWIDFTTAGTNKDTKSQKLEDIFTTDFDYQFEGDRMDDYIGVVTQFTNPAYDASNINGFGDEFKSIITFTYSLSGDDIVDRAYLASELSAGFYTDIFEDEYAKVTPNPTVIDFYGNDYGNLNPIEADGVHGSLALIDVFAAIGADPLTAPDYLDDLQLYFTEMGSKAHTLVTGGLYPTAYNYTNWTAEGNSLIACIFYAAEVVPSAEYAQFHALMVTAAWNNHTTVVSLDVNPYDTNFVFEIQSDKITYSFTA